MTRRQLLEGQAALVTGANSGIGRAVAIALAEAGADVAVNWIVGEDEAAEVVDQIERRGRRGIAIRGDVSDEAQVIAMFRRAAEALGELQVVVPNAGVQRDAPFSEMTLEAWRRVLDVNLTGQFLCCREAVREFLSRPRRSAGLARGKIVCTSSVHEVIPWAGHVNYAASKGGVMLMMKSLAQEVAPLGIRVNSVAPGAVRTPINTSAWSTPEAYRALMELVPYGRIGEPEDVGRAVVWLASDESDYVTGASLFVDGGMTLYPGFATGG